VDFFCQSIQEQSCRNCKAFLTRHRVANSNPI